ncbi:unnamed protein product [Caenorhabditis sp. 36 PRJEB53466]|nr:unnamed protein product [Caenorhabditis sp. 36 PRJEB53466]
MSDFPTDPYLSAQQKWLYQDHLVLPTLTNVLGPNLNGKTILDIGCGNGMNSVNFIKWGAQKVVGFDYSLEMVKSCQESNRHLPNFEFHHADVTNFSFNDRFDIATAIFVLQYVHDKSHLKNGILRIYEHLKNGGVFVGLLPNGVPGVRAPEDSGPKLGAAIAKRGEPYVDGELVTANFYEGDEVRCTSTMALHSNEFYENCFKEVGFQKIEWFSPTISERGRQILGSSFCVQFLNPPVDIVFRCFK